LNEDERAVVDRFHRLYYDAMDRTWKDTYWRGVRTAKCPMDMWIYQEILWETRPDLVIECGTAWGGSALFFASMMDLLGAGSVVTIDIAGDEEIPGRPSHPRIAYLQGSSTDPAILATVRERAAGARRVMVVLDSDHSFAHVSAELEHYAPLVTPGDYLVVEDTNVNGRPVVPDFGPGPGEAVEAFLSASAAFDRDAAREKFFMTFNPGGYLRKRASEAAAG
jgi:cephalosporin hydroxylase